MTAQKGSAFLLRLSNGATPIDYQTVAGLRSTQLTINSETVVITNKGSEGWRDLLTGAGIRSVSVSAAGIFLGSTAEINARQHALSAAIEKYELSFENGERLRGKFQIQRLEYAGDFNGERTYTLQLESSGPVASL